MTALDAFPPMSCPLHGGDRWSCRPCGERMLAEDRHGYPGSCRGYKMSRFRAEQQFPCDCGVGGFPMAPDTRVTLPRAIVKALVDEWPLCGVCVGNSPSRDGHDANPPCVGYAREQAKVALNGK